MPDRQQLFWLFFRLQGRVSRAAYFLAGLLLVLFQLFLFYKVAMSIEVDTSTAQWLESPDAYSSGWTLAFWLFALASVWPTIALAVKRLHDIGLPGLFAAATFIPVLNVFAAVALCIYPGDPGPNRYGSRTNAAG